MKRVLIYICTAVFALTGCIVNDIPYPVVVANIISMEVEGATNVDIDYTCRTITIHMPETADLREVSIKSVEFSTDMAVPSMELVGTHDLTSPIKCVLKTYADYTWKIVAVRDVDRYFTVKGQMGSAIIDDVNCRAIVMVGKNAFITNIEVTSLKLGPEGLSEYSLELSEMKDFTHGITVEVTAFDVTQVWTLFVEISEETVGIKKINPWAREVYVTSLGVSGVENGFRYRKKGDEDWIDVNESDITVDGGTFLAHIRSLEPETEYQVMAYCGTDETPVSDFTTTAAAQLPNSSFEYASKVSGSNYYKFYDPDCGVDEGAYMFWGSGNGEGVEGINGSGNLGIVITYVDEDIKVDGNQSVRAQTSSMAGMLAAGNIFTGQFAGLVGTSGGRVNFGRPWTTRPLALKMYCRYSTGKMNIIKGFPDGVNLSGEDYDRAEIKIALGTWDSRTYGGTKESPVYVNTTDSKTFVNFTTDPSTVADGNLIIHHDGYILNGGEKNTCVTGEWVEYTIPLNYHNIDTVPTHIIISCASSQFGDYFSGCDSSKLWIDKLELIY